MISVGINGLGRIGKSVLLQLINNTFFSVCCINATNIKINEIEDYLKYDSTQHYDTNFTVEIVSDTEFKINHHKIKLFSNRDPSEWEWDK